MNRFAKSAAARAFGCFLALGALNAPAQEAKPEPPPPASQPTEKAASKSAEAAIEASEAREAALEPQIDELVNGYDLSPQPLPEIPDDPPPHEGAMIALPTYRIEPPDLVLVEVLEALPGRPISGERLVRPDGMMSLGFYGEVDVRGLTIKQVKVKIIKHLRKYLTDSVLGLVETWPADGPPVVDDAKPLPPPFVKDEDLFKLPTENQDQSEKPREAPKGVSNPAPTPPARARIRVVSDTREQGSEEGPKRQDAPSVYFNRKLTGDAPRPPAAEEPPAPPEPPSTSPEEPAKPVEVPLKDDSEITIRINVKKGSASIAPALSVPPAPMTGGCGEGEWYSRPIPPDDSDRVFIDVTAYNSKNYFVLGDVAQPGKLPSTGNETVLDALQYAGGFLSTADRKSLRLVRPGRNGKPGKVYKVDVDAIVKRGETATNYQLFPNDRLVVDRDEVVEKTIRVDRTHATIDTVVRSILQAANMVRSVKQAEPDHPNVVLKNLVEFWIRELNRPEGAVFDEAALREFLLRGLNVKPDAPKPEK